MSFDNGQLGWMCYWIARAAQGNHMTGYRCFLMSGEHIQAVQTCECADDAEVILKARTLLDSKPEHPALEIWEGSRLVARLTRNPTGETSQQNNVIRVVAQNDD
ncbi:MAG: hypothetical protein HC869_23725 [Rhodospirillales bacterium]|nr:hypothetical protein [Rhodospirillales bacterium]